MDPFLLQVMDPFPRTRSIFGNFDITKCLRSFLQGKAGSKNETIARTMLHGRGYTSSKDVRTSDGLMYPPPAKASRAAGYLKHDRYFHSAM